MKPEEVLDNISNKILIQGRRNGKYLEREMMKVRIEALEKQVAKKPERLNAFKCIGKCRGCEKVISTRTASAYCQYCGSKVDWGNEE